MFVNHHNNTRLNDLLAQQGVNPVRSRYSDYTVTKTVSRFFLVCAAISGIAFLVTGSPIALVSCGVSLGLSLFFSAIDSRMRRYHHHRPDPSVVVIDNRPPVTHYGTNVLLRENARLEAEANQRRLDDAALQASILRQQEAQRERAAAAAQAQRRRDDAALAATLNVTGTNVFARHMPDSSQSAARLEAEANVRRMNEAALLQANLRQQQEAERERAAAAAQAQRRAEETALAAASRARAPEPSVFSRHMPESSQSTGLFGGSRHAPSASSSRQRRHETDTQQAARQAASAPRPSAPAQTYTRHMPESQQQPPANPQANQYKRHMPDSANK